MGSIVRDSIVARFEIMRRDDGCYTACEHGSVVVTPKGHEIVSSSKEFIQFLVESLNLYGTNMLGLTPYGIESSRLDFGICGSKQSTIHGLSEAHDEACRDPELNKDDWMDLVLTGSPRTLAALVTICGNIGWPEIGYEMAAKSRMPCIGWFNRICPIVQGDIDPRSVTPNLIAEVAEDITESFATLLHNDDDLCANCTFCLNRSNKFVAQRCAIYRQFALIKRYIELGKIADQCDDNTPDGDSGRIPISRDQAREIARSDAIAHGLGTHVEAVLLPDEITSRSPSLYGISTENSWVAYIRPPGPPSICSSTIVVMDRNSGKVRYRGSASDEG